LKQQLAQATCSERIAGGSLCCSAAANAGLRSHLQALLRQKPLQPLEPLEPHEPQKLQCLCLSFFASYAWQV